MQYIKGIENYQNENRTAITLGKFDGLHLGHELLVERVREHKNKDDVDSVVFAFDMKSDIRLLTNEEKAAKLDGRVDYFVDCPFTKEISDVSARDFIEKILVGVFHVKYIVVGTDFRFGYNRQGDVQMLKDYAHQHNYHVEAIEKKQYHGREISSTYVKEELKKGNLDVVKDLLGYSYEKFTGIFL